MASATRLGTVLLLLSLTSILLDATLVAAEENETNNEAIIPPRGEEDFPTWPAKVILARSCPLYHSFVEDANVADRKCCREKGTETECILYSKAVELPVTVSMHNSFQDKQRNFFYRMLMLNSLVQSVSKCSNVEENLSPTNRWEVPEELREYAETIGNWGPCTLMNPEVPAISYTQAIITAMPALDLIKKKEGYHKTARVLILGLGAGTIAMMLSTRYPDMKIDVVEIEPTVLLAAKYYFGFKETENLKVYIDEASKWLQRRSSDVALKPYDLLILDVYDDVYVAKSFLDEDSINYLKETVETTSAKEDNGLILANVFCGETHAHYLPQLIPLFYSKFPSLHLNVIENPNDQTLGEGNCIMLAHDSKFGFGADTDAPDDVEEDVECGEDGMCELVGRSKPTIKRLHRGVCDTTKQKSIASHIFDDATMSLYEAYTKRPFRFEDQRFNTWLC